MPKCRIVIGLNSGTSADGVDAAACAITGRGLAMRVRLLGFVHRAYPDDLRKRLLAVMAPAATRTEELCRMEVDVGHAFADAAAAVKRKLKLRRVDLIGSHGQTICHLPPLSPLPPRERVRVRVGKPRVFGTLQIGDAAIIAAQLNCPVVHHFRQADMAVGGQGAPLVPWTDYVLFKDPRQTRIVQNIGGIANLTWLRAGGRPQDVIAFDTGPGNMAIDALVQHFTKGRERMDRNGRLAQKGGYIEDVLYEMEEHPFLWRFPPKSCGREEFGSKWVQGLLRRFAKHGWKAEHWIQTATFMTARSIIIAYLAFLPLKKSGPRQVKEVIFCGGGTKNKSLMSSLASAAYSTDIGQARFSTTADYGIPSQAKESVSFAMLAAACVDRVPANLPQVTGAKRRVVLGQICDARPLR